jgi:DMSO/TMAO reductase YedYZ molybdopterin-dependent catalytic subunit
VTDTTADPAVRAPDAANPASDADRPEPGRLVAAAAGVAAAAAALAASELIAGLIPGAPSLVLSIGGLAIDLQPAGAKDIVVALFGLNDKLALEIGITVTALLIAAGLGIAAARSFAIGAAGFAIAAAVGLYAALQDTDATPAFAIIGPVVAAGVGIGVLGWLLDRARPRTVVAADGSATMPSWSRRSLLITSGGIIVGSSVIGLVGRRLLEGQRSVVVAPADLPRPDETASLPTGASLDVEGITPLVVPNDTFYRIDTALIVPRIDVATWSLRVHGMVDREVTLNWNELTSLPAFEQYVTIACVSNEVGGGLVGNAKWTGVRLRDVLAMAGVQDGATQLVGRSEDGFTAGMPTAWVMDPAREPMIAYAMNDEPLPLPHGHPARLIVPGLFGYVSATKWLTELELTTLEAFDGYWVPLGWAKEAPILTQSRIDVPRAGGSVLAGQRAIAGVAWAPDRGVSAVEVSIDGGAWQPAVLSEPISDTTWVQWRFDWHAERGDHQIEVRATDGTGTVQTDARTRPAPDGARGHHAITVRVT